ncbi:calcium-binding protein CML38-like [Cornus florida]|uniref:calcium-binding protein CML38-like n=1 Tax=Cornus florida TaxID=4283 RepID=UPI00289BD875|nr:calcium-binding protein CML38-like [Cornus florida]
MKSEATLHYSSTSSPVVVSGRIKSDSSSAIGRLCRKLSPRKLPEKSSLHLSPPRSTTLGANDDECSHEIQRVFMYFDENGDGKISPEELQSCVRTVGGELSDEEAEMAVRSSDSDGDGMLGLEDFRRLMENGGEEERKEELREAFKMYEMEGTGCITPKSLKRMLSRLGKSSTVEDCKAMISMFDINGDGVLNFEEFTIMMH